MHLVVLAVFSYQEIVCVKMDNMVDFCGFLATWRSCILMVTIISVYLVLFEPNKFPFFYCISSFQFSNFDCFGSLKFLRDLAF